MHINLGMSCCGLREIAGLSDHDTSSEAMEAFARQLYYDYGDDDVTFRHVIFTQAGKGATYGENFAKYIRCNKLGTVKASSTATNPNTGNPVKAFIWTLDIPAFEKWAKKNDILDDDE